MHTRRRVLSPRRTVAAVVLLLAFGPFVWAQDNESTGTEDSSGPDFSFGMDLGIGVRTFQNPDYDPDNPQPGEPEDLVYQSLQLKPDVAVGKLGVGLDLTLNYTFTDGPGGNEFGVRQQDWVPDDDTSFLELYLPKIRYLRWAQKGDPLFILLGQIDSAVLGNAFIVGGYTNTRYLPERAVFGMQFDVDGALFDFPYVGVETFTSNLAALDVVGGRLYVRPLSDVDLPLLPNLEVGTTYVTDTQPYYYEKRDPDSPFYAQNAPEVDPVQIWGADVRQPILNNPLISLAVFSDVVQQRESWGSMVGFGGRTFGFLSFGAQARFLGENFTPVYFDSSYDLYRAQRYAVYSGEVTVDPYIGWLTSLGFSFLQDELVFGASLEGAFEPIITETDEDGNPTAAAIAQNPVLRSSFRIGDGVIPGVTVGANYEKRNITSFQDLFSAENAVIGARINYRTGPAVISLLYDLRYDPNSPGDPWQINSGLETSIQLF